MKFIYILIIGCLSLYADTVSLDSEMPNIHLKNNAQNILKFPFVVQKANLTTEFTEDYSAQAKNKTIVLTTTALDKEHSSGDLLVWTMEGNVFLLKLHPDGTDQVHNLTSTQYTNVINPKLKTYETGRIESDIKSILKSVIGKNTIPGYEKVSIRKKFKTEDLEMQKEVIFNGGAYRVEEWYIKNRTKDSTLFLEADTFYTRGVIAIAFEKNTIKPGEIAKAWFVIDKNTLFKSNK